MSFVWEARISALGEGVVPWSASYKAGGCRASVSPGRLGKRAPSARGQVGAIVAMVSKGVALEH